MEHSTFYFVFIFLPIGFVVLALVRKSLVWHRWISTVLFLLFLLLSTIGFDALMRGAGMQAEQSNGSPEAFSLAFTSLYDSMTRMSRALTVWGICLWVLTITWPEKVKPDS